jgi:hypothetical protein
MSTIISIRSAISSPGRLTSRDALLHWPSGGRLLWRRQPPARGCVAPSAGDRCCSDKPVRAMLADDVRLDLVAKLHRQGKSKVGEYYRPLRGKRPMGLRGGHGRSPRGDASLRAGGVSLLRRRPISSRSISRATASSRSVTSYSRAMRWTASRFGPWFEFVMTLERRYLLRWICA